ncbi:TROVE domain-containing protein [Caldicellulosiruptor changbaiensis]|uniref:TROVE domain-containing protein n=1 Tax=Caldicellulosiruptor changbaiensis TaxID=1222016 RepID=UPI0019D089E5|nr:TROVE domain-containing protein [Caldicellulosiruptor changbaiensis]
MLSFNIWKLIPNSLKKGVTDALHKFDEYQLAKDNRRTTVKLRGVLFIFHPKPRDSGQADLWKRLIENKLSTPYTWETEISTKGNKKEVWEEHIDSGKLPYMALLRNFRSIVKSKCFEY